MPALWVVAGAGVLGLALGFRTRLGLSAGTGEPGRAGSLDES